MTVSMVEGEADGFDGLIDARFVILFFANAILSNYSPCAHVFTHLTWFRTLSIRQDDAKGVPPQQGEHGGHHGEIHSPSLAALPSLRIFLYIHLSRSIPPFRPRFFMTTYSCRPSPSSHIFLRSALVYVVIPPLPPLVPPSVSTSIVVPRLLPSRRPLAFPSSLAFFLHIPHLQVLPVSPSMTAANPLPSSQLAEQYGSDAPAHMMASASGSGSGSSPGTP
ncbi:hypothetical protein C8F01DRAFT_1247999 [Mycena amicta]|nr:hypothetical protein C8F01DRAFT_1247999 [Mycena amicta]